MKAAASQARNSPGRSNNRDLDGTGGLKAIHDHNREGRAAQRHIPQHSEKAWSEPVANPDYWNVSGQHPLLHRFCDLIIFNNQDASVGPIDYRVSRCFLLARIQLQKRPWAVAVGP